MRRLIKELMVGKNNLMSGLIALGIVSLIALGCTCNKDFKLGNTSGNTESNSTVSNTDKTPEPSSPEDKLSDTPRGEVPSELDMEKLTKTTLLDFNDAVQKGDFSDFYDTISKVWKRTSTPQKFNEGFSEFIDKKIDISNIKGKVAQFDPQPTVKKKSGYQVLDAKGKYDTSPLPVRFETEYIKEGGEWKLISIRVDTRK